MLGRIGIDGYDYENYINIKEYGQWKIRMEILNNISNGNLKEVYQKIKTYSESYDKYCNGNLKMQFCIFAYAQIKKRKGYNRRLGRIFADALECTVKCSCDMISSKVLSVQELLFIMDDACYNRKPERMQIYEQVVEYIEKPYFDVFSKAMIYPKAVVNICREIFMEQNEPDRQSYVRMLELCSGAKDILGEAKRTYYLWELSRLLKNIYSYFLKNDGENSENGVTREQAEGNQGFMRAFKEAGRLAGISVKMQDDTYIYKEYGVYCTADVIYKRRRTLGLTVRQLADGYMIERTLAKIESGRANPHATTIKELFKRLNMSAEYSRLEIVTDKVEAKDTIRKLKANCNGLEYDKALVLLTNLKGMIDLDIPVNRQYIIRTESCIEYDLGLIDKQQHIEDIIQALECTIPYEKIVYGDELFMTQEESMCINSIFSCGSSDFDSKKIEFIEYVYKNCSDINHEWMYDVFMSNIASWCGNEGDYDTSDRLSRELIKNCLIKGRLNLVDANFYNMAWNMKMRGDCAEKDNDYREYVLFAYYISSFCKKDNYKQLYSRKLKE